MWRPTGARISHPQGDGGNSATLPEESTKDTVKTIRAGKAGRPATPVVHPVCIPCTRTRVPPAPGLPCALWQLKGAIDRAKLGRNAPREREAMSAMTIVETGVRQTTVSCPGRSAARLQRCAAEPGPIYPRAIRVAWVPALRSSAGALRRVRDTGVSRRHHAPALPQSHILQLGEHAGGDRLRDDHELAGDIRRHRAGEQ